MDVQGSAKRVNRTVSRRVLALVNRKSGLRRSFEAVRSALDEFWDLPGIDLVYQFCQSAADGTDKARRAVERSVDIVLVAGGDGTVNSVGRALIGTEIAMGVIPTGSGNGFARHFGIPLSPSKAARALAAATATKIDVGFAGDRPFLVTCSMAWDAAIARSFERSPIRGIIPYVFAGVQEFFEYQPQDIAVELDGRERLTFPAPIVFTVANLTQYGGGARIAPHARHDDGFLELVTASRQDIPVLLANLNRFFDGTIDRIPKVVSRQFRRMVVRRERAAAIQIDGEFVEAPAEVEVRVAPGALNVLVPAQPT
jgi:YegS/Rv2252/BmrU family lipid kinase